MRPILSSIRYSVYPVHRRTRDARNHDDDLYESPRRSTRASRCRRHPGTRVVILIQSNEISTRRDKPRERCDTYLGGRHVHFLRRLGASAHGGSTSGGSSRRARHRRADRRRRSGRCGSHVGVCVFDRASSCAARSRSFRVDVCYGLTSYHSII